MTRVKKILPSKLPRHLRLNNLLHYLKNIRMEIAKSIRLQILFATALSLILATFSGLLVQNILKHMVISRDYYMDYGPSKAYYEDCIVEFLNEINELNVDNTAHLKEMLDQFKDRCSTTADGNYFVFDKSGNLIYQEDYIQRVDLVKVVQKVNNRGNSEGNMFLGLYPIAVNDEICYLYIEAILEGHTEYYYNALPDLLGLITGIGVFIFVIFKLTKQKIDYIEYLSFCLGEISKGDLSYEIDIVGKDELAQVAKDIIYMEREIKRQIETKLHAEKLKNELVTNVAHDLRTPLTSVLGYIGLVRNKKYDTQEEADKYIDIAYNKADSLRILIEDLFELTKLHQQIVKLNKETVSMSNLIGQLTEEFMAVAADRNLEIKVNLNASPALIQADIPKITRVLQNLLENAIKYGEESSCIYVELKELEKSIFVAISNKHTQKISEEELDRLFDRFYRTDESRNSQKGGSGLGLAIAKEIVNLHGGIIKAKLNGDYISFVLLLPKTKAA